MTLAHIDELVKKVGDPQLRAALEQQVATLTSRKQFGLVFQEHSPESVRLPQQRIRTGDKVELRDSKESPTYHVLSTKASLDVATVVEMDESGETVDDPQDMLKSDLVVVKPFGDPVYPGLRQVGEAGSAKQGQPTHVVINGENYHALQALQYTHEGKVDLIYIDPPYNTGAADWKYNDKYIDGNDSYRHSKWLSFMEKRLKIAKSLLKDTGVIILAIDDNEHHRLRMLADQVFSESNFLANITWQGRGKNDRRFSGGGADYMVMFANNKESLIASNIRWNEQKPGSVGMIQKATELYSAALSNGNSPEESATIATKGLRLYVKSNASELSGGLRQYNTVDAKGRVFREGPMSSPSLRPNLMYDILHPATGMPVPTPKNGWSSSESTMAEWIANDEVVFGKDENRIPGRKLILEDKNIQVPLPTFTADRDGATKHLEALLGDKRFPFPKNHDILMRWFRIMAPTDAVIVDFFAGSGTTAESVIRLNAEDGGTRQAILVTNNELAKTEDAVLRKRGLRPGDSEYEAMGVFHHVTKPRISTVLTGVREDGSKYSDGIEGQSATFFDLTYEDENLISLGNKFEAIAPLLWMQSGATGELIAKRSDTATGGDGYSVPENGNYAVIFDTDRASEAIAMISLHGSIKQVFVVSDSDSDYRAVTAKLPGDLKNTAIKLYSNYLRSFEINRR